MSSQPLDTGQTAVSFLLRGPGYRSGRYIVGTQPCRSGFSSIELVDRNMATLQNICHKQCLFKSLNWLETFQHEALSTSVKYMFDFEQYLWCILFEIYKLSAITLKPSSFSWCAVARKLGRNECCKGQKQIVVNNEMIQQDYKNKRIGDWNGFLC